MAKLGFLKNGNRPFDLAELPKCGAKARTTGQPCKAPAMRNGRCKYHGGMSTGPRTPEGKERSRRAHLKHGRETREERENRSIRGHKIREGWMIVRAVMQRHSFGDEEIEAIAEIEAERWRLERERRRLQRLKERLDREWAKLEGQRAASASNAGL